MSEIKLQKILMQILKCELCGVEDTHSIKAELTEEVILTLYEISKKHDIAHIVCAYLEKNKLLANHLLANKYYQEEIMSVCRYEQQKYTLEEIRQCLSGEDIPYVALKGSVIRNFYPTKSMRTSCDIDVLVKEQDLDLAIKSLQKYGYELTDKGFHDVSLYSPSGVHLELHFNLLENKPELDKILKKVWDYAVENQSSSYEFNDEFFIFHILAHISYHFTNGGCGLRSLMDLWIIRNKMHIEYEIAKPLLQQAQIYSFTKEIYNLVDICFGENDGGEFYDKLLYYIITGGVYGTADNRVAVDKSDSVLKYSLKRIFLPYRTMKIIFPILNKAPILLPFCWIARIFQALFGAKRKKAKKELEVANSISSARQSETQRMLCKLGLK